MSRFEGLDPFAARRAKREALLEAGIPPYPSGTPVSPPASEARRAGAELPAGGRGALAAVAGRIMSLRGQGSLVFADLQDASAKLQLAFKADVLAPEAFGRLELLDLGDFIHAAGTLFVSKRGELTLEVSGWSFLAKALSPLPDGWKGLQDAELRQRQRPLDLLMNPGVTERFQRRSALTALLRRTLAAEGFTEVETSTLESIPGGADAEPFVTKHNALNTEFYLRISLELQLKRLLVGGMERVYEIGKVFRNEGISPQHLQEFTMLELYRAYWSVTELMPFIEGLYRTAVNEVFGAPAVQRGDRLLDFGGEWPRTTYAQLLKEYAGVELLEVTDDELVAQLSARGAEAAPELGRGRLLDMLYKKAVRPHLLQPQFVTELPLEFSPLAKKGPDPRLVERIVVVIDGVEVGNGFSELNDPVDQRQRFEEQERLRLNGDPEAQRLDENYLEAMSYGMPPAAGFGVSIDRLFMVLAGLDSVRETVLFPLMRPEKD